MGATSIEWVRGADGSAGFSWNALRAIRVVGGKRRSANHCETVNEACRFCYAARMNLRLGGLPFKPGHRNNYTFELNEETLLEPLRRRKPAVYFVESMSDAFGEWWPRRFVDRLYAVMHMAFWHTFINLSKRPQARLAYLMDPETRLRIEAEARRIREMICPPGAPPWPAKNIMEGVSVSQQSEAEEFVPLLLQTPCAIRIVSAEPLLGPIDFTEWLWGRAEPCLQCPRDADCECGLKTRAEIPGEAALHGIIVGGESGPSARPMNPQWAREIRDECEHTDTAYFHKQNGEFVSVSEVAGEGRHHHFPGGRTVRRVGKKRAGRLLDGREHNDMPRVR